MYTVVQKTLWLSSMDEIDIDGAKLQLSAMVLSLFGVMVPSKGCAVDIQCIVCE